MEGLGYRGCQIHDSRVMLGRKSSNDMYFFLSIDFWRISQPVQITSKDWKLVNKKADENVAWFDCTDFETKGC